MRCQHVLASVERLVRNGTDSAYAVSRTKAIHYTKSFSLGYESIRGLPNDVRGPATNRLVPEIPNGANYRARVNKKRGGRLRSTTGRSDLKKRSGDIRVY